MDGAKVGKTDRQTDRQRKGCSEGNREDSNPQLHPTSAPHLDHIVV